MVWDSLEGDSLEGDPSASFDAEGWFLCCGPRKIQFTNPLPGKFWWLPTDKRPKQLLSNHHN
jgi:hypothetical protein